MDRTELSDDCDSIVSFSSVASSCSVSGVSHHIFVDIKYMFLSGMGGVRGGGQLAIEIFVYSLFFWDRISILFWFSLSARSNSCAPLPATSAYFTTSEPRAKLLTRYHSNHILNSLDGIESGGGMQCGRNGEPVDSELLIKKKVKSIYF
jgi:hypothetical protein